MTVFELDSYHTLFVKNARDCLNNLKTNLITYNSSTSQEKITKVTEMFRLAHMIKGQSAFMNYQNTTRYCLLLERVFKTVKEKNFVFNSNQIDQLIQVLDTLSKNLDTIDHQKKEIDLTEKINSLEQIYKNQYENSHH